MLNSNYWQERYATQQTGWDAGTITTPIKEYIDQLTDKSIKILIPGCGNAHEAAYLWQQGFNNVFLLDYVAEPLNNFSEQFPEFPKAQLILKDFFELNEKFDLIIEQTFFCALDPSLRKAYAEKIHSTLNPDGKLVGVLFNCEFEKQGPPFGGTKSEYLTLFESNFEVRKMDDCYNSIQPRKGNELFVILCQKKSVNNA
jgi:SAM-dependent methyltransferase